MAGFVGSVLCQVIPDLHFGIHDNHSHVVVISIAPYATQRGSRKERACTLPTPGIQIYHIGTGVNLVISQDQQVKWCIREILKLLVGIPMT